jgi:hypothetical protein
MNYCVVGPVSATDFDSWKAAGGTHVLLQAGYDQFQSSVGGTLNSSEVTSFNNLIDSALAAGLKVVFEPAAQYPPSFYSNLEKFTDQSGNVLDGANGSGNQVPNYWWTELGRTYMADFLAKLGAAIDLSKVDRVRIGGGPFNELRYPNNAQSSGGVYSWWGFGTSMQTGSGLSSDQIVCPYPGYVPFSGGGDQKDSNWINWYLNGQNVWLSWLITQIEAWTNFTGLIYVLHPAYGIRSTNLHSDTNFLINASEGDDPCRTIASYAHNPRIWPWCTWADYLNGNPAGTDTNIDAWAKIIREAQRWNKDSQAWCENTGGEANAGMAGCITAAHSGYSGFNWVAWSTLHSGLGSDAQLAYLSSEIVANP